MSCRRPRSFCKTRASIRTSHSGAHTVHNHWKLLATWEGQSDQMQRDNEIEHAAPASTSCRRRLLHGREERVCTTGRGSSEDMEAAPARLSLLLLLARPPTSLLVPAGSLLLPISAMVNARGMPITRDYRFAIDPPFSCRVRGRLAP